MLAFRLTCDGWEQWLKDRDGKRLRDKIVKAANESINHESPPIIGVFEMVQQQYPDEIWIGSHCYTLTEGSD